MISDVYVAGLFDGEGCIGIYFNKGSKCIRYKTGFKTPSWNRMISIAASYKPVLEKIKEV